MPKPPRRDVDVVRTSFILPRELWLKVKQAALLEGRQVQESVAEALRDWVRRRAGAGGQVPPPGRARGGGGPGAPHCAPPCPVAGATPRGLVGGPRARRP